MPDPKLVINPQNAVLTAGQTQKFEATLENGQPAEGVTWSIQPSSTFFAFFNFFRNKDDKPPKSGKAGRIDPWGIYVAPSRIFLHRRVVILAEKVGNAPAMASVELIPLKSWTQFVGFYLLTFFLALVATLFWGWDALCPTCKPGKVRVSPPVVTLMPGQSQTFTTNMDVQWEGTGMALSGLYTAPPEGSKTQVRATAKGAKTGTAEVFISPTGGLSLQPLNAVIRGGGSVDFTAVLTSPPAPRSPSPPPQAPAGAVEENAPAPASPAPVVIDWMSPETGTLKALETDGLVARFSVPDKAVDRPTTFMILVRTRGESPARIAGAWVTVQPQDLLTGICGDDSEYKTGSLLLLLAIMGALGGLIHGISSFTTFVGNREFLMSWVWWYIFKPFLAALVALVVFLVFRAGFDLGNFSLGTADCLKAAAFAALIGLFAEQATIKLKDIFETLFTPKNDPRRDEAGKVKKTPKLDNLDPASVTVGQGVKTLTINGTDFAPDCQVKIGSTNLRKPTSVTTTKLVVPLQATDLEKPDKVDVIVFNKPPDGEPSNPLPFEVKQP